MIRNEALRLGFLECGFSKARHLSEVKPVLDEWLAEKRNASTEYMEQNIEKRLDPSLLVENSKTVISLLFNYYSNDKLSSSFKIARYAYGSDYHFVLKDKLKQLDNFIRQHANVDAQRYFVDSAPVMERAWAQESGLGWIGKNSCLISRRHGSFVFLAEIITTLELDYDEFINDYCGNCRNCIDACPTHAILENRTLDSNKCISYHTIENRGEIPEELKSKFSGYIFGCDICQEVCPWNTKAHKHNEPLFQLRKNIRNFSDNDWVALDEETYRASFKGSPVKRTKFSGIKRNIKCVMSSRESD